MGDFTKKLGEGFRSFGKSTGKAVKQGKIKLEISKHQSAIQKRLTELGERIYQNFDHGHHTVALTSSDLQPIFDDIIYYKKKISELESQSEELDQSDHPAMT